ncbi:MAG TPA: GNAT family N-acetyltransferase [Gemmatimonadales bacterium]|jgi:GNAT superfamily N-acetyltransferase|nr:GNAT family N-acetyltransferase [Gemmatimonadales bacterium]
MTRSTEVVISHLEMTTPPAANTPAGPDGAAVQQETGPQAAALAGWLYRTVGADWHWRDRLAWSDAQWQEDLDRAGSELWTARQNGAIAGYFELVRHDADVDIKYFGLLPDAIGRGIGRWLLSVAIERAWALGPGKVTVNTCTLDSPRALPNYLARGFRVVRREHELRELPA